MLVYHRVIDDGFKCSKPKQSRWIVDFSIPKRQSGCQSNKKHRCCQLGMKTSQFMARNETNDLLNQSLPG